MLIKGHIPLLFFRFSIFFCFWLLISHLLLFLKFLLHYNTSFLRLRLLSRDFFVSGIYSNSTINSELEMMSILFSR